MVLDPENADQISVIFVEETHTELEAYAVGGEVSSSRAIRETVQKFVDELLSKQAIAQ